MAQAGVVGAMVVMAGSREMDSVAGTKEKVAQVRAAVEAATVWAAAAMATAAAATWEAVS